MNNTSKGLRLQIGIFGKRNAGKSSLFNALQNQQTAIVSDIPGTTTDPIEKALEIHLLGPVILIDTAGLDDEGLLGKLRVEKTEKIFERADLALIVSDNSWNEFEEGLLAKFQKSKTPCIAVFNKSDLKNQQIPQEVADNLAKQGIPFVPVSSKTMDGIEKLRTQIIDSAPEDFLSQHDMLHGIVSEGNSILLITPIDKEAPKGRMILPQVQTIRSILDHNAWSVVTNEKKISSVMETLGKKPDLAITDSQAFAIQDSTLDKSVPLTSFSILMARMKGDLATFAKGAAVVSKLNEKSRILIAEACSHHPIEEDIGTVKIPRLLRRLTKCETLQIEYASGHDFLKENQKYDLVIHCGACTFNRKEMLSRISLCHSLHIPITNYGMTIAECLGILERALAPFPDALNAYLSAKKTYGGK